MNSKQDRYDRSLFARRQWLQQFGMGIGAIALQQMLAEDPLRAEPPVLKDKPHRDLLPRATHFAPRAKAMISLFQHGGPSHMDLTDPKPELTKYSGTFRSSIKPARSYWGVRLRSPLEEIAERNCQSCFPTRLASWMTCV